MRHRGVAPLGILAGAFGIGISFVLIITFLSLNQPYLGVGFSTSADGKHVFVGKQGSVPEKVSGIVSPEGSMDLLPLDLTIEPDGAMGDYKTYGTFLSRQEKLAEIQRGEPFTILTESGSSLGIIPSDRGRPVYTLPYGFWIQVCVGLVSFLVSASVFAFRQSSAPARYLLLSGVATLIFAPAAALYSTRELALPGTLFRWMNDLNFFGGSLFAASFAALLLHYPKKLAPWWVGVSVVFLFVVWFVAQQIGLFESMTFARRFLVMIAVLATFILAGVQWVGTRRDPVARAALKWFLLSWILGTGLFAICILLPQLFGIDTSRYQGYSFLLFILVYAGLAFGIIRYRLFELGAWWRSILVWSSILLLLTVLYFTLVVGLRLNPGMALAIAVIFGVIFRVLSRNWLWGTLISPPDSRREELFSRVVGVALGSQVDQKALWEKFLTRLFNPLDLKPAPPGTVDVTISGDGAVMIIPAVGASGALLLEYPDGGSRLFSRADSSLARESWKMLAHALESRDAHESGVAEERSRIALDIHDNISSQLLCALHSPDVERKDLRIRETMAEIREMIRGSSTGNFTLEETLAELRFETGNRLAAAEIDLVWSCDEFPAETIAPGLPHALRSVIREGVSNIIKHSGASRVEVSLTVDGRNLSLLIADDGCGFDHSLKSEGSGLSNFHTRLQPFGAEVGISSSPEGTRITATILLEKLSSVS